MIQRVQTVFLLLALVMLGFFLWMPLIQLEIPHLPLQNYKGWEINTRYVGSLHFLEGYLYFVNIIFSGIAAGFTLLAIVLFKNRNLQMLFCWFAIVFIVFAEAFIYYRYMNWVFMGDVILTWWNLLALGAIIFEILAFAYIRKDEEMIKGMDRLR